MSYHRLNTKPLNASLAALLKRGAHLGVGLGAMAPMLALANPSGGQVVGGQANISNPGANGVVVKQTSQSAIINWQQFNIGQGQYVQFIQPSSSSVVLNRVVGGGASSIFGSLTGNGQVFLVNSNGVYFGKSATLDLQGFLASTLDISDGNFLAGHYVFDQAGTPGATITNEGKLRAHKGGYIILAGDYAQNDGLIAAQSGHVILASGAKTTLNLNGNQLVNFAVNTATLASYAGVTNTGKLIADGGTVLMTADVANALKATVVNNSGLIEAHAINKSGGTIQLLASGGNIQNPGALDANATKAGIQGGTVVINTDGLMDLKPTSRITALGDAARGGKIVFHAEDAKFGGQYTVGRGGTLLLDPAIITINSGPTGTHTNTIGTSGTNGIDTKLNAGSSVVVSAGSSILKGTATNITAAGAGGLTLKVGTNGKILLSGLTISIGGAFKASAAGSAAQESYSNITATAVTFNGFGATITDHADIKATTGNISIHAHGVDFSLGSDKASNGSVGMTLAGGAVLLNKVSGKTAIAVHDTSGTFSAASLKASNGFVSIIDNSGAMNLGGANIIGKIDVTIIDKKGNIFGPGAHISASHGNVAVLASDGSITLTKVNALDQVHLLVKAGGRLAASTITGGGVSLSALGNLVLDSANVTATNGNVIVKGGTISMNAGGVAVKAEGAGHGVNMSATGGTLSAGNISAGGNVTLKAIGHEVFDARKIKTTGGNLTVTGKSVFMIGTSYKASAGSVNMTASSGNMSVSKVTGKTGVTLKGVAGNIKATGLISASDGNVGITASSGAISADAAIKAMSSGHKVSLLAIDGNIHAVGKISAASGVSEKALGHTVHDSSLVETIGGNISIRAGAVTAGSVHASNGSISLTANSGSLIVGPVTGKTGVALSAIGHTITAGGNITAAAGNIKITAAQLTGGSLSISAGGKLTLAASIGKASAGNSFGHNVTLKAGSDVFVERSIYAGANQANSNSAASNSAAIHITAGGKVVIGAPSRRVNLFAGGSIDISGKTGVEEPDTNAGGIMRAGVDTAASHRDLTLTASSGAISIAAMGGTQHSIDGGTDPHAHTWNLIAGHDVIITAQDGVTLKAGNAVVSASTGLSGTSASHKGSISKFDNVNIQANHSIKISTVTGNVDLSGGSVEVKVSDGDRFLNLQAFGNVRLSASSGSVNIKDSSGQVNLKAGKAVMAGAGTFSSNAASAAAFVHVRAPIVNISGKGGVNILGGTVTLSGSGSPRAEGTTSLHGTANAGIQAGSVIINASSGNVDVSGGHVNVQGGGGSSHAHFNLIASGSAFVVAGAGGINVTAGQNLTIHGGDSNTLTINGSGAGQESGFAGAYLLASNSGAIDLTATHGNVTISKGQNQTVSHHGTTQTANFDNGVASIATKGNLTVGAGQALDVHTASINASIHSISLTASNGSLSAGNLNVIGNITLTDKAGNLNVGNLITSGSITLTDKVGKLTVGNITANGSVSLTAGQLTGPGSNASSAGIGGSISAGNIQGKSVSIKAYRANRGNSSAGSGQLANIHVGNVTANSGGINITASDQIGNSTFGGGRIDVAGNLQATKGSIDVFAFGVGSSAGKVHVTGTVTTLSNGNVSLSASHAGVRRGGSLSVGGSINAAGNVDINAFHDSNSDVGTGGNITVQSVTGLRINLSANDLATWSGGIIHVNGNLHATGPGTGDGVTVTVSNQGFSSSVGGRIDITGNVTADHGDVTLTASNSNAAPSFGAQITAGSVLGRHVTVTAFNGPGGSAINLGHVTATNGATISAANGGAVTLASGSSGSVSAKALGGNLIIKGGSLTVTGGGRLWLSANNSIDVTANIHSVASAHLRTIGGNVSAAGISASGNVTLTAGGAVVDHGSIDAAIGNVIVTGKSINALSGAITAGGDASLTASTGNLNVGGVSANAVTLNVPNGDITGNGTILARQANLDVTVSNGYVNFAAATLKAGGSNHHVSITDFGGSVTAGDISTGYGSVNITAVGANVTDHGTINARGLNVTIKGKSVNTTGGNITAGGSKASLSASSGSLNVGGVSANAVTLKANGNISGYGSIVAKNSNLDISASNGVINFGSATLKAEGTGHHVHITEFGNNLTAGNISASGSVTLAANSGHSLTDHGTIKAKGGNVTITGISVNTTSGTITATGKATLSASSGSLQVGGVSANSVNLNANGSIGGNGTVVARNSNLTITATNGSINFGSATLKAEGSAEGAGHNVTIADVGNDITAGAISASGSVTLTALGHAVTDHGNVNAKGGKVTITAKSINASSGNITAHGNATLSASSGSLFVGGVSANAVTLKSPKGNLGGNGLVVARNSNLDISASNGFINFGSGGKLVAEGAGHNVKVIDVGYGLTVGSVSAAGAVTISAAGHNVRGDRMIVANGGNVTVNGKTIDLQSGGASAQGKVLLTASSAAATLDAGRVIAGSSINLSHTGGDIKLVEARSAKNVTISAGTHEIIFNANHASAGEAGAFGSNVTLKAHDINNTGFSGEAITLQAEHTLTINALLGSNSSHRMEGGVFLEAGNDITLAHGIFASGSVAITAPTLAFTGGKSFSVSAANGNLSVDAAIGTAVAPVKYNINLTDSGGGIFIQKSIFTGTTAGKLKANINANQTFVASGAGLQGVVIGSNSGGALTLSTRGNINITAANIVVGDGFRGFLGSTFSHHQNVGAVTLKAANINLTATSGGSQGRVIIAAGAVSGDLNSDRSVLLQATGNITVTGAKIDIFGGSAFGVTSGAHKAVKLTANTAFTAGGSISITGSSSVDLAAGRAGAFISGGTRAKGTYTAEADAELNMTAAKKLTIHGGSGGIGVSYGYGDVVAIAGNSSHKGVIAKAATNVSVNLSGANVSISGGTAGNVSIGGSDRGFASVHALGASDKATGTVNANINITGTTQVAIAGKNLRLTGANDLVNGQGGSSGDVKAAGHSAAAVLNVAGGLNLTAGKSGITLNAQDNLLVVGGVADGLALDVIASSHGIANARVTAGVNLTTTTGTLTMKGGGNVTLAGGAGAGAAFSSGTGSTLIVIPTQVTANGGKSALAVDVGVGVKAAKFTFSAGGNAAIAGGIAGGSSAQVTARQAGSAALTASSAANIAVTGTFKAVAGSTVSIRGGIAGAESGSAVANHLGDKATLTADGAVKISARTVTASGGSRVDVSAGIADGLAATASDHGGAATVNADGSVSITAVTGITFQLTSSGTVRVEGGHVAAASAQALTGLGGKALVNVQDGVNLTTTALGAGIALKTGDNSGTITIRAAGQMAAATGSGFPLASAGFGGGVANINANGSVNIKANGALTLQAGNNSHGGRVEILGGSSEGFSASVFALKGGKATITDTAVVNLSGAAVTINAGGSHALGSILIAAGGASDAANAVIAGRFGGVATETIVSGVTITTPGAFTATAGSDISITGNNPLHHGGQFIGASNTVFASHSAAQATLNLTDTVAIKAGTVTLTAADSGFVFIAGADSLGLGASVSAVTKGDKATYNGAGGVSITATAGAIGITAHKGTGSGSSAGDVGVFGGGGVGAGAQVFAANALASATLKLDASVSLTAKTGLTVTASQSASFFGGSGVAFAESAGAKGKGAKTTVTETAAVKIGAATLNVTAKGGSLIIGGGDSAGGFSSSTSGVFVRGVGAISNGSVAETLDASVSMKATGKLILSASGFLGVRGGDHNFLVADAFNSGSPHSAGSIPSAAHPGGKVTASLTTAVSLTAGSDINLTGSEGVGVRAGDGAVAEVGAARFSTSFGPFFFGNEWNGGVASLTENVGVTVKAGHNLNITAKAGGHNSGSIQVNGMRSAGGLFGSVDANVHGGTSAAIAKVTLLGNVALSAANNVTLQAAGNASIIGGSLFNLRADHAVGNVTILGSADATLHAGNDVLIKGIGGSLTVAGVGVNSSHGGEVLADAHADQGLDNVTGHADATLSAGHNISMISGASLGGAFNVVAGEFVFAVAKGISSTEKATATANATVSAGNSIAVKGQGDLNLLGGLFDSAAALAEVRTSGSTFDSAVKARSATMQAKTTVSAGLGTVTLNLKGDGVIAGGDSLKAEALMSFLSGGINAVGAAAGDVSTTVKGANVAITVGGNLLLRGGSGELASAAGFAFGNGGGIKTTATANAGANISAKGNVTINVGTGTAGTASIVGGSAGNADAFTFNSNNAATATAHGDVTITAGAALKLTVAGPLKVAGGPGAAALDDVVAGGSSSFFNNVFGTSGSAPAFKGTATGTLTSKVLMTAGTTLTVNAGKAITILGGSHVGSFAAVDAAAGSSHAVGSDKATLSVDASVAMKAVGKLTVAATSGGVNITTSILGSSSLPIVDEQGVSVNAGARLKQSVTLTGGTVSVGNGTRNSSNTFASSAGRLTVDARIRIGRNLTLSAQPLSLPPVSGYRMVQGGVQLATTATSVNSALSLPPASGVQLNAVYLGLDLLQSTSLVTHLVPLLTPAPAVEPQVTVYSPGDPGRSPEASLGGACRALLQRSDGRYRCAGGNQ